MLVLNGPNLNLLGRREPELYGTTTLDEIEALCHAVGEQHDLLIDFRQSNHEGVLVDAVQEAGRHAAGIAINAASYTHTSVALRDALAAVDVPIVEVHLTNIHRRREEYRHTSFVSEVADAMICGAGAHGYALALIHLSHLLEKRDR
ncbi:type II 3-dehydroquinate dehydratase [Streptosporangium lutulentum]